jgi:hypothetical protein
MTERWNRRVFLGSIPAVGILGPLAGPWATRADDPTALGTDAVRLRPEIEPLVKWIEDTPRDRIIDQTIGKVLREGLSYRDLMAGIFLAAIRTIKPRPVGFKFHAVMAVHSAHLLGQTGPRGDEVLAMLWALDNYKGSQEQDRIEGDWTLGRVDESHVPAPSQARQALDDAMDRWDSDMADVATAGLCRSAGAAEVMECFYRYGVRDQRNIGHKPIFTMQCWRTLQTIGWQHAEPVLRSLAFGLLDQQGESTNAPAGPYAVNRERAGQFRSGWRVGKLDQGATERLLDSIRHGTPEEVGSEVVALINAGVAPESLWDAVALAGSEMLLSAPGIVALHSVTSGNSLHYIFGASGDDSTRKLCLLQAASWMPLYRTRLQVDKAVRIDTLEPEAIESSDPHAIVNELSEALTSDRLRAARKVLSLGTGAHGPELVFELGRSMIVSRGRDSHQYKFGMAAWEESRLASDGRWRAPIAAATMAYMPTAQGAETNAFSAWQAALKRA